MLGRALPWLVLAFCLWYLLPTVGVFSGLLDEGLVLAPADRILHGQVPYRDFYLFTGPLIPYLFAGWMEVFGASLLSAQILLWLVRAGTCALLYPVAARLVPAPLAVAPSLMLLFSYAAEPDHYVNHWVGNLFLALALATLAAWADRPSAAKAAATGATVGWAALTLHSFGTAMGAAAVATMLIAQRSPRPLLPFAAGLAAAVAPWLAWFAAQEALVPMWHDLVTSNLYRAAFEYVRPATALGLLASWLRPQAGAERVLSALVLAGGVVATLATPFLKPRHPVALATMAAALGMYAASTYRLLPSQLQLHAFPAFVLAVHLGWSHGRALRALGAVYLALFLPLGYMARERAEEARHPVNFPRGSARVRSPQEAEDLQRLVRFLEKRNAGRSHAFFTPYEPNLYFLMDLRNPTPYQQMRALQYSPDQMEVALEALRRHPEARLFHFPAYESDDFLLWSWPDIDLGAYRRQWAWFEARLEPEFEMEDFGAVRMYRRRETNSSPARNIPETSPR